MRDGFGIHHQFELYSIEELDTIVRRSADILGVKIEEEGSYEIARRSRGTPRIANRMLKRVRDYAQLFTDNIITKEAADAQLLLLEVDELGLDNLDRRFLRAIVEKYDGGPVGLETLAAMLGEERDTLEDMVEPYLMQLGFLNRTNRGRAITRAACVHLCLPYPKKFSRYDEENSDDNQGGQTILL